MLDQAINQHLAEIKTGRKPRTYAAYDVSLRYFFESTKNKPLDQVFRTDLIDFVAFLSFDKRQSPRCAYNKFESVMTFLRHYDITGKSLNSKPHRCREVGHFQLCRGGARDRVLTPVTVSL